MPLHPLAALPLRPRFKLLLGLHPVSVGLRGRSFRGLLWPVWVRSVKCLSLIHIFRQNLAWAFVYNLIALPLAMTGFVTPWMAGIGMSGSSLLVVLNSLRLQKAA